MNTNYSPGWVWRWPWVLCSMPQPNASARDCTLGGATARPTPTSINSPSGMDRRGIASIAERCIAASQDAEVDQPAIWPRRMRGWAQAPRRRQRMMREWRRAK